MPWALLVDRVLLIVKSNEALLEFAIGITVPEMRTRSPSGPRMACRSASFWSRRAATNALTASSAEAKLRWGSGSGAFAGAACATANQRITARIAHRQDFSVAWITS